MSTLTQRKPTSQSEKSQEHSTDGNQAASSSSRAKDGEEVDRASPQGACPPGSQGYSDQLIPKDCVHQLVYDSPDLNKAASLYSRTDLYKCVSDLLHDLLPLCGLPEVTVYQDLRLLSSCLTAGCAAAVVTGAKLPADTFEVFCGVILFGFLAIVVLGGIDTMLIGQDTVYITKTSRGDTVWVSLTMHDGQSDVKWRVTSSRDGKGGYDLDKEKAVAGPKGSNMRTVSRLQGKSKPKREDLFPSGGTLWERGVERYFDEEGYCVHENLFDDFCEIVEYHTGEVNVDWNARFDSKEEL